MPVRALAVFVVATPCPLILAAPIALMCGVSRGRRGPASSSRARERSSSSARRARCCSTRPARSRSAIPSSTAWSSTERPTRGRDAAPRRLARPTLLASAREGARRRRRGARTSTLTIPEKVEEQFGKRGPRHASTAIACSSAAPAGCAAHDVEPTLPPGSTAATRRCSSRSTASSPASSSIGDRLRADSAELVPRLREAGIRHVALVTGDKASVADAVGQTARRRPRLRRADARAEARGRARAPRAARPARRRHGRRRHQRRPGARARRRRHRDGLGRRDRLLGDRRRRHPRRPRRPRRRRDQDRAALALHRPPERPRRHRALARRHGLSPRPATCRRSKARCCRK